MLAISQFYQGLELTNQPAYSMQQWGFESSINHDSARGGTSDTSSIGPDELNRRLWAGDADGHSLSQLIFYPEEVKAVLRSIHDKTGGHAPQVSSQDAITAFAIDLYNRMTDSPVTNARFILTVIHSINHDYSNKLMIQQYRQKYPTYANRWRNADMIGNGIYLLDVPIAHCSTIEDKATAFRKAIIHSREPKILETLIAERSTKGFDMMQNGKHMPWSMPGTMVINGLQRCASLRSY
jgi:hypothetical protein